MIVSDSQRAARNKWDRENMTKIACRIRKEYKKQFQEYAKKKGKSVHALLLEYVMKCIKEGEQNGTE